MQLYEQIEKEFDEKINTYDKDGGFIVYVDGYDNQDFDTDLIKSFLKQSFIKFLEGECERLEKRRNALLILRSMEATWKAEEISDTISHYQNMIKELHG